MDIRVGVLTQDLESGFAARDKETTSIVKSAQAREVDVLSIYHIQSTQSAKPKSWTIERDKGFIDGLMSRKDGTVPPKYALVGRDEYCLGFRAGYFASDRKSNRQL
jgi:hypothetical protein